MADDPKKTDTDRKRISLKEEYEMRFWKQSFGCTREQLEKAVTAVGDSADAVRTYLDGKKKR